ncbi:MAG: hypothetical protein FWH11_11455 [Micrococcales bacterium]|nr:hypothetical protein [Micrococcales bacterium]
MRTTTPRALVLCAALTALVLGGCTSPDPKVETTSPAPSTPSIDEDQAVADATAALHRFYQVLDQCYADPANADASCFDSVAVDQVLTDYRSSLEALQNQEWHHEGHSEVLSVKVVWVNVDGSFKQVRLTACVDQRTWRLVDGSGAQLGSVPTAPQQFVWQLINYDYPEAEQWKVSYYPEEEPLPC